jgi:hypothetical protein
LVAAVSGTNSTLLWCLPMPSSSTRKIFLPLLVLFQPS